MTTSLDPYPDNDWLNYGVYACLSSITMSPIDEFVPFRIACLSRVCILDTRLITPDREKDGLKSWVSPHQPRHDTRKREKRGGGYTWTRRLITVSDQSGYHHKPASIRTTHCPRTPYVKIVEMFTNIGVVVREHGSRIKYGGRQKLLVRW